jgi:glycosyltransferase involved in cell wall biosynthesis
LLPALVVTSTFADVQKIGILVVAYNAASTLDRVLDRIPRAFRPRIHDVLVFDDHSSDATYLVGLGYQSLDPDFPLTVLRHPENLGYGGNQKAGYRWAIEHGLDIVVLLHGDGQYAPEYLPAMVAPLERGECDAVFGSRMMIPGGARSGGMPLYKFVGNRVLTAFDNAMTGTDLSEWHSGYRAYRVAALRDIPFEANSNGFDFDSQIIIQLHEAGKRITEIPIPTFYGDEISYVNGMRYARDTALEVFRYRLHKMGLGDGTAAFATDRYELNRGDDTAQGRLYTWLSGLPRSRVLHVGCSDGVLSERIRKLGHEVTGVETEEHGSVRERLDRFEVADLDEGIPIEAEHGFDAVVITDALARVRDPARMLADAARMLTPTGSIIVCVPNFGHWYPRARVLSGLFDYDRLGLLDRRHVRFFTRRSFERLARSQGLGIRRREAVGPPVEALRRGGRREDAQAGPVDALLGTVDGLGVALRPTLFAYQFLFELGPASA